MKNLFKVLLLLFMIGFLYAVNANKVESSHQKTQPSSGDVTVRLGATDE